MCVCVLVVLSAVSEREEGVVLLHIPKQTNKKTQTYNPKQTSNAKESMFNNIPTQNIDNC